ncbi:MAG: glycosyltransferase [Acidobacteriaceae bacterium]
MIKWQQRIIFVSPFFYPELISTGKANQRLAEALVAEGHEVAVVCSHPLYPSWVPARSTAGLEGMKIVRGGARMRYPRAMPLRRLLLEAWFAIYATRQVKRLREQADLVVSILPPSLFALFLDRLLPRRVRRVAVIHDLQGVLAAQKKNLPRRVIARLIHAVESRVFRAQDLCIFFSGDMARVAQQLYRLDAARVAVQYPFVTLPIGEELASVPRRLAAILPPEKLHVVYSGALGFKQNSHRLAALLQAAAERHPDVQFHIFSGGPLFDALKARYRPVRGPGVEFHPLVEEQDLKELYARSAIQIIPQAEGTEAAALPSKLPNLLAAGVHLLAICGVESEVGRLIQQAGTGTIAERWEEDLFLTRLDESLEIVRRETAAVRRARVEPLMDLFSVTNLVRLTIGDDGHPQDNLRTVGEAEPGPAAVASETRG